MKLIRWVAPGAAIAGLLVWCLLRGQYDYPLAIGSGYDLLVGRFTSSFWVQVLILVAVSSMPLVLILYPQEGRSERRFEQHIAALALAVIPFMLFPWFLDPWRIVSTTAIAIGALCQLYTCLSLAFWRLLGEDRRAESGRATAATVSATFGWALLIVFDLLALHFVGAS